MYLFIRLKIVAWLGSLKLRFQTILTDFHLEESSKTLYTKFNYSYQLIHKRNKSLASLSILLVLSKRAQPSKNCYEVLRPLPQKRVVVNLHCLLWGQSTKAALWFFHNKKSQHPWQCSLIHIRFLKKISKIIVNNLVQTLRPISTTKTSIHRHNPCKYLWNKRLLMKKVRAT